MEQENSSGADVTTQPEKESRDVKTNESSTEASSKDVKTDNSVETTKFGGFELPKPLYESMKQNFTKEAERKIISKLQEENRIADDTMIEKVKQYEDLMNMFGESLSPGKKLTPSEADELIKKRINARTDDLKHKLEMKDREYQDLVSNLDNMKKTVANERKVDAIKNALLQNGDVNQEMIPDLVFLIDRENRIVMDEDLKTPIVIESVESGERAIATDGNFLSVQDFINQWIAKKPQFKKVAGKSGLGGQYEEGANEVKGGPPHTIGAPSPIIKKIGESREVLNLNRRK